jgi:hypothetical protein
MKSWIYPIALALHYSIVDVASPQLKQSLSDFTASAIFVLSTQWDSKAPPNFLMGIEDTYSVNWYNISRVKTRAQMFIYLLVSD